MVRFGYTLLCEQAGPQQLVRDAERAERAGFDFLAISDHYFPWLEQQGHAPYAWSVLGAVAQATERIPLMTFVTCPTFRYHPTVVAQKAATMGLLSEGRFALGIGAGENLNEHVVGGGWPPVRVRHQRLREACEIIRALWDGGYVNYEGRHFTVESAKLFDRPEAAPRLAIAVSGPRACEIAGTYGDAVIAIQPRQAFVDDFVRSGGRGKPAYAQLPVSYDQDRSAALKRARDLFRWGAGGWKVMSELPAPVNFDAYSSLVSEDGITQLVSCGPDTGTHVQAARGFLDAGFDHLALVGVGGEQQEEFIGYCERDLLPALRRRDTAG